MCGDTRRKSLGWRLLESFFADSDTCCACGEKPLYRAGLCRDCYARLSFYPVVRTLDAQRTPPFRVYTVAFYNNFLRALFARYKFEEQSFFEPTFAAILGETAARFADLNPHPWATFIPLERRKEIRRGANPAEALCRGFCKSGRRLFVPLLTKRGAAREQNKIDSVERARNVQGIFSVVLPERAVSAARWDEKTGRFQPVHVPMALLQQTPGVLVDDFVTSGNTLREAEQTLRSAGILVDALVLAAASQQPDDDPARGAPHTGEGAPEE
uniref:ComF family protein n=1 Tax=Ndongobacter massiliensis TaxID=1871025 RepID=UPI000931A680|nr:ComF family protein [Ndongobacter massiliensis]